jgi:hypothetical protein
LLSGEVGAVEVSTIAVAGQSRVELKECPAMLIRDMGHEADLVLIEDVIAAIKYLWPVLWRLQEVAQRWDGPVVQVRGARPDPVQRLIGVAVGLTEVRKTVLRIRVEGIPRVLPI